MFLHSSCHSFYLQTTSIVCGKVIWIWQLIYLLLFFQHAHYFRLSTSRINSRVFYLPTCLPAYLLTDLPVQPCVHPGPIRASMHVCIHACIHPSVHACIEPNHARMHACIHPGIYPSIHCNTKSTHPSLQNQRKCLGVWYRNHSLRVSGSGTGLLDSESRPGSGIEPSTSPMRNHRLRSGKQNYLVLITLFRKS